VTDVPETRFTRSADGTSLAYQVSGEGPLDVVFFGGEAMPVDLLWDDPVFLRLSKRLGRFSRTVWAESRGAGASEGDFRAALVGEGSDADVLAVLDATVGTRPAALVGWGAPGGRTIQFSAAHPERVSALVLVNSFAHYVREEDYPYGIPRATLDQVLAALKEGRDTGAIVEIVAPSRVADEGFRAWWARAQRLGVSAHQVADAARVTSERDLRPLLGAVSVPTLVLHREGNRYIRLGAGRYLAEHIPGARLVALPGADHEFFAGDVDSVVDEIEEFLTGVRSGAEGDVFTATVLFTDIVGSTEHQARVGAGKWSRLADEHDAVTRAALLRYRGREVKTTGDGVLATFDATARALRCATEIIAAAKDLGLQLRAGVHTGEIEVRGDDLGGLAVSIAKRVCDLAPPGQVLVSETVRINMLGTGVKFDDRGKHELRGVPGAWPLYAIATRDPS
jgi:class 3 adenylate cyclase